MQDYAAAREMMVDCQVRPSDVTRYAVIDAMLEVPRERFVPSSKRSVAYAGEAIEMAAVLSRVCRAVISIESDEGMAKAAEESLLALGYDNAAVLNTPLNEGADSEKPFDVILVQGGVGDVPQALFDQLFSKDVAFAF